MAKVQISDEGLKRIVSGTVRGERQIRGGGVPARRQRSNTIVYPKVLAKTSGVIAARSVSGSNLTPGSGSGTLGDWTGTGWNFGSNTVTLYNCSAASIASGVYVQAGWIDGRWVVDVEDCP